MGINDSTDNDRDYLNDLFQNNDDIDDKKSPEDERLDHLLDEMIEGGNSNFFEETKNLSEKVSTKTSSIIGVQEDLKKNEERINSEFLFKLREASESSPSKEMIIIINEIIENYLESNGPISPDGLYNCFTYIQLDLVNGKYMGGPNRGKEISSELKSIGKIYSMKLSLEFIELSKKIFVNEDVETSSFFRAHKLNPLRFNQTDLFDITYDSPTDSEVLPDSINEEGPKHIYTIEEANAYLDELNKKYPINEIIGSKSIEDLFLGSFIGEGRVEGELEGMVKASLEAGKWVGIDYSNTGYTLDSFDIFLDEDRGIDNSLNADLIGFYNEKADENELKFLKYAGDSKKRFEFTFSLSLEEQIRISPDRTFIQEIYESLPEEEKDRLNEMSEEDSDKELSNIIKEKYPNTYKDILPDYEYLEQLKKERLSEEEIIELFGDEEGMKRFTDSLNEEELEKLKVNYAFHNEKFGKEKLQMMPKENMIRYIVKRLK